MNNVLKFMAMMAPALAVGCANTQTPAQIATDVANLAGGVAAAAQAARGLVAAPAGLAERFKT